MRRIACLMILFLIAIPVFHLLEPEFPASSFSALAQEIDGDTVETAGDDFVKTSIFYVELFLLLFWAFILVWIYRHYDKEFKVNYAEKYEKQFPGKYSPALVGWLVHPHKANPSDILASLLNLVYQGFLQIQVNEQNVPCRLLFSLNRKSFHQLAPHERYLIQWLQELFGSEAVNLQHAKEKIQEKEEPFYRHYQAWKGLLTEEAETRGFVDKNCIKGQRIGRTIGIFYILLGFISLLFLKLYISIIIVLMGLVLLWYAGKIHRRSRAGQEQFAKWMAFKRSIKEEKCWAQGQWMQYLPYYMSLDCTDIFFEQYDGDDLLLDAGGCVKKQELYDFLQCYSRLFDDCMVQKKKKRTS